MSRFTDSANDTAAEGKHVPYVLFADFYFLSGHVRVSSAARQFTWGGYTWGGIGALGGIEPVRESADLRPDALKFTLSGVDSSLIYTTLSEAYHNRECALYLGYLDAKLELVTTPQIIWEGRMDVMSIQSDAGSSTIGLACESRMALWNKSCGYLYTHEYQRLIDVTDDFFTLVPTLQDKVIKWGEKTV